MFFYALCPSPHACGLSMALTNNSLMNETWYAQFVVADDVLYAAIGSYGEARDDQGAGPDPLRPAPL